MAFGTDRGGRNVKSAIKNHYDRIESAIRTGKMSNVKSANNQGYSEEKREVRDYR
jgi:hypothetical protein